MTGAPLVALAWRTVTAHEVRAETAGAVTIALDVEGGWPGHRAGQHVDVRLTAEDGYQAERSYSIASAPEDERLALTVERIDDGEVSPYLAGELRPGDQFEVRGPIGGHFTWSVDQGGPLLLIAGGSGLVPLMAMLRHRAAQHSTVDTRLLLSSRSLEAVLYRDELAALGSADGLAVSMTLTRAVPEGWTGFARRIDLEMLRAVGPAAGGRRADLRLRPDAVRRERGEPAGGGRSPSGRDPRRAVRTDGRLRWMPSGYAWTGTRGRPALRGVRPRDDHGRALCPSCGESWAIGAHRAYWGAGVVLRCPGCDDVALVVVVGPDRQAVSATAGAPRRT